MTMAVRVLTELRRLRKGRGVEAARLDPATTPYLCELAGSAGGVTDRQALIREIHRCAGGLKRDLQVALLAGLGLLPETKTLTTFTSRVEWLVRHTRYQNRTMLRRVDSAEELVAEEIVRELLRRRGRGPVAVNDWYVEELRTVLRLDTDRPEAHERRRIVALKDGLDEVMAWTDVPGTPENPQPMIDAEVVYGGNLIRTVGPRQNQFRVMIALPAPLAVGQPHEYELVIKMREGEQMRPHYILTSECRLDDFHLRVRFDPNRLPLWVRRVEGEPVRTFDLPHPDADQLALDQACEVAVSFRSPTMFLGYGLQWAPVD